MKIKNHRKLFYFIIIGILSVPLFIVANSYMTDTAVYTEGSFDANLSNDGFYNVAFFGSDINKTITFAGEDGKIFIPCGTYTINSPIVWFDGQIIEGENKYCVIIATGSSWSGYSMFQSATPVAETNVQVRGITFDGNSRVLHGIYMNFTKISLFEDLQIRETNVTNMLLDQDNYYTEVRDSIFQNVPNNTGIVIMDNEVTIRNARLSNYVGINVSAGNQIHLDGVRVDGGTTATGIVVDDVNGLLITGSRIELAVDPTGKTCLNVTSQAREVIMIGGLFSGCQRFINDQSNGELNVLSVGGYNNNLFYSGLLNITSLGGIQASGQITTNGSLISVGDNINPISTMILRAGNNTHYSQLASTFTTSVLSTSRNALEIKSADGTVYLDNSSVNNKLVIRDSNGGSANQTSIQSVHTASTHTGTFINDTARVQLSNNVSVVGQFMLISNTSAQTCGTLNAGSWIYSGGDVLVCNATRWYKVQLL